MRVSGRLALLLFAGGVLPIVLGLSAAERTVLPQAGPDAGVAAVPPALPGTGPQAVVTAVPIPSPTPAAPPADRLAAFRARRSKTVVELQPWRRIQTVSFSEGAAQGRATLVDLAPWVGAWYLLRLDFPGAAPAEAYHLESREPRITVTLDPARPYGLVLETGREQSFCSLWSPTQAPTLAAARLSGRAYADLCRGRLYLRNRVPGRKTSREWTADFLRDRVKGGEKITSVVRDSLYRDAFRQSGELERGGRTELPAVAGSPPAIRMVPQVAAQSIHRGELAIPLEGASSGPVVVGHWYPAAGNPGVWLAVVVPELVAGAGPWEQAGRLAPLDKVERIALVYLIAFDLDRFEMGFELGTDHPGVGWSERYPQMLRDPALQGPDGIGTMAPLVMTGKVSPALLPQLVSTFTGGFKRNHGAFRIGPFAERNDGSHYGFVEQGTVLSRLQPGLATAVVWTDGRVELLTWGAAAAEPLETVRFARQNGVPLVEIDPDTGASRPGALVRSWAAGNWSGSKDQELRTLRAGLGLVEAPDGRRFLVYGYFSTATPSAMARVFLGAGCRYAMHLDMNALEHTYLALYQVEEGHFLAHHLVAGMEVLDQTEGGEPLPRFVAFSDNRDFFYLVRKDPR